MTQSAARDFERGQTVRLKSGGPMITINAMEGSSQCICVWFVNDEFKHQAHIAHEALVPVPAPSTGTAPNAPPLRDLSPDIRGLLAEACMLPCANTLLWEAHQRGELSDAEPPGQGLLMCESKCYACQLRVRTNQVAPRHSLYNFNLPSEGDE